MTYTREELDWIEAEWAYHLHGRSAFLSREDFHQLLAWGQAGIPADVVVNAMEGYFDRRARRAHPRSFVALAHLAKDVEKGHKLREASERLAGPAPQAPPLPEAMQNDPKAHQAFAQWQTLKATPPPPDSPAFLDHFDAEQKAFKTFLHIAELALGPTCEELRQELQARLSEAQMPEGTLLWKRAWDHHWQRMICERIGIQA